MASRYQTDLGMMMFIQNLRIHQTKIDPSNYIAINDTMMANDLESDDMTLRMHKHIARDLLITPSLVAPRSQDNTTKY
jgi:hypothetical protein